MKKNIGTTDKVVRISAGLLFIGVIAGGIIQGPMAIVFGILATIFILTALINFCPIYYITKLSTRGKAAE